MTTVKNFILNKGAKVFFLGPDDTVTNALTMMRDNRVRSVMVIDSGKLVGILSQGDCAIKVLLPGKNAASTSIASVMTKNPLTVSYDNTVDECMAIMNLKRIRHLPVLHDGQVTGLISIGDIVKNMMKDQVSQINFLETYIRGHGV